MSALAIIIDPWINLSIDQSRYAFFMNNVKTFCDQTKEIEAVALSCHAQDPANDGMYLDGWIENSELWFKKETKWDRLRREWCNLKWESPDNKIHPTIIDIPEKDHQVKFVAISDLHILYYCRVINPGIDSIYFLGCSWSLCVKDRPTGWLQIASLQYHGFLSPDIKLLTESTCVYDVNYDSFPEIQDPWYATDHDRIYQLDLAKVWS